MKITPPGRMSRVKKKLLLYFILISIVSISVSAEIIFEMSSERFREQIKYAFYSEIEKNTSASEVLYLKQKIDHAKVFSAIDDLRNRMILLLIVVFGSIVGAFVLFTKDLVAPMESMVEATKKIADGDLTVMVPVMSQDELGQMAKLINTMNADLQDMIMQIRQETERHKKEITRASGKVSFFSNEETLNRAIDEKKMKVSEMRSLVRYGRELEAVLDNMLADLSALQTYVSMYKTYAPQTIIEQSEIDNVLKDHREEGPSDEL